MKCLS